jgi:hypothetical protein
MKSARRQPRCLPTPRQRPCNLVATSGLASVSPWASCCLPAAVGRSSDTSAGAAATATLHVTRPAALCDPAQPSGAAPTRHLDSALLEPVLPPRLASLPLWAVHQMAPASRDVGSHTHRTSHGWRRVFAQPTAQPACSTAIAHRPSPPVGLALAPAAARGHFLRCRVPRHGQSPPDTLVTRCHRAAATPPHILRPPSASSSGLPRYYLWIHALARPWLLLLAPHARRHHPHPPHGSPWTLSALARAVRTLCVGFGWVSLAPCLAPSGSFLQLTTY